LSNLHSEFGDDFGFFGEWEAEGFANLVEEACEEELAPMTKIGDKRTTALDLRAYHDGYKEWIQALISPR
jgi:hypothetical protein